MEAEASTAIEREIAQGEHFVQLILRKNELLRSILQIDEQLAQLVNKPVAVESSAAKSAVTVPARRGRKPKGGGLSVAGLILQVLASESEGLTMSEIAVKLRDHGFSFEGVDGTKLVASTLSSLKSRSRISKDESGRFSLLTSHKDGESHE